VKKYPSDRDADAPVQSPLDPQAPPLVLFSKEQLPKDIIFLEDDRLNGLLRFQWHGYTYVYLRVEAVRYNVRITAYRLINPREREEKEIQ